MFLYFFTSLLHPRENTSNHAFADSEWHHLLLTWNVISGQWFFRVDNKIGFHSSSSPNPNPFPGGHLILGQSRNRSGDINEGLSLRADVLHFNIWEHVFTEQEALQIYSDCRVLLGTLVPWPEIQVRLHGDVKRTEFVRCQAKGAEIFIYLLSFALK